MDSPTGSAAEVGALPLLAPPSGATHRFRKRCNDLDEVQEEALRAKLRQHIGAVSRSLRNTTRKKGTKSNSLKASHVVDQDQWGDDDDSTIQMASTRRLFFDRKTFVQFLETFLSGPDTDMAEEIDEKDPKLVAGKKFLSGVEAFASLTENELLHLVAHSELRTFRSGEFVLEDERKADGLFIVMTGSVGRFSSSSTDGGVIDNTAPLETINYQEHFGINPVSMLEDKESSTSIVVLSDYLECIWIPEVVIRMLNLHPRMEYEFVVILHNPPNQSESESQQQEQILINLLRAGLHVTVMANTRNSVGTIILLLSAPLWLLAREDKLMAMERIIENHAEEDTKSLGDDYEYHAENMTASDRIAAFASILTRSASDKPPGAGIKGLEPNQDEVIRDIFPLQDPVMLDYILSKWFQKSHSASLRRLFFLRVKDYFGLRVAFFIAFERLYNASLLLPLKIGVLLWVFWRWIDYKTYTMALGVYGLGVGCIWAPWFIKRWLRYQNSLLVEWNLLGTKEVETPNPEFANFVVETINVAQEGEPPDLVEVKTYDDKRRWPKYVAFVVFCLACLVLMFLFVGVYVQWYVVAVMTPVCTDPRCPDFLATGTCVSHCEELFETKQVFLFMQQISSCASYCDVHNFDPGYYQCNMPLVGCFETEKGIIGTGRWCYVFVQGVVLGLTLDIIFLALFEFIASKFNKWENYPTLQLNESKLMEKVFLFNWVGYFYWFFLLAFLYVPYGKQVQQFIREHADSSSHMVAKGYELKFSRYWIDGLISMDSAFVTPMIVTQALNLLINTFVPFILRRALLKARNSYQVKKEQLSATALKMGMKAQARFANAVRQMHAPNEASASSNSAETQLETSANDGELTQSTVSSSSTSATTMNGSSGMNELEHWLQASELDRMDLVSLLVQREPIAAGDLEHAILALFGAFSSHDDHMNEICSDQARRELDAFQLTSYEWIDRITRRIEAKGNMKGLYDAPTRHPPGGGGGGGAMDQSTDRERNLKIRLITKWRCRNYEYTADKILEESSMGVYSPFSDLLHLAIQFSYTIMFSVVWPFCCCCSYVRNVIALRFDAIRMALDCKRPVPRRTIGLGAWIGAFMFEVFVAELVVPGLFVYVSGQFDAFVSGCEIHENRYGPSDNDCLSGNTRLGAFVTLENLGIAATFVIFLKRGDIADETSAKIVEHSRRLRHNLRKSLRLIGETILVSSFVPGRGGTLETGGGVNGVNGVGGVGGDLMLQRPRVGTTVDNSDMMFAVDLEDASSGASGNSLRWRGNSVAAAIGGGGSGGGGGGGGGMLSMSLTDGGAAGGGGGAGASGGASGSALAAPESVSEWREGTVSWVRNGRLKVNFSGGRQLGSLVRTTQTQSEHEVWLNHEKYVLMDPQPVKIFDKGATVLLASKKFGRWMEATIVALDNRDRFGNELEFAADEMHLRVVEARNLRKFSAMRTAGAIDPFFVVTVGQFCRETSSVKRKTMHPVWDERFVLELSERALYQVGASARASVFARNAATQFVTGLKNTTRNVVGAVGGAFGSGSTTTTTSSSSTTTTSSSSSSASIATAPLPLFHASSGNETRYSITKPSHAAMGGSSNHSNSNSNSGGMNLPLRTLKVAIFNNDPLALGECIGELELDLAAFRTGEKHRLQIPLSACNHRQVWTVDALHALRKRQLAPADAGGGASFGTNPFVVLELQWIDTRLPTRVSVRVKGHASDLVLSRKYCETTLCYGINPNQIVQGQTSK